MALPSASAYPPPPPRRPAPAPQQRITPMGWAGIVGCAAGVVGSFMAWITITSGLGSASLSGTEGDGKLTAAVGICAGLLALVGLSNAARGKVRGAAVLSAVGAAISTFEWQHVSSKIDDANTSEFVRASVGNGIWVMLAGFVVATICLFKSMPPDPPNEYVTPVAMPTRPESPVGGPT